MYKFKSNIIYKSRFSSLEWFSIGWVSYRIKFIDGKLMLLKNNDDICEIELIDHTVKVYADEFDVNECIFYIEFDKKTKWKLRTECSADRDKWVRRLQEYIHYYEQLSEYERVMLLDVWNNTPVMKVYHSKTKTYYTMFMVTNELDEIKYDAQEEFLKYRSKSIKDTAFFIPLDNKLYAFWNYEKDEFKV